MSALYNLQLSAMPDAWRLFLIRKNDDAFFEFSKKILTRDEYTCQFCGFQASEYQEIVNLDQNYRNNSMTNMVTACCFCAQCFFLEAVGKDDYGGGVLIFLPEMSQGDLNGFCHVLFCAMANATGYRTYAQDIYRNLKLRAQSVEKNLGEGMSDPSILGRILIDSPEKQRFEIGQDILKYLRLLPSYTKFNKQIEDWAKAAVDESSPAE